MRKRFDQDAEIPAKYREDGERFFSASFDAGLIEKETPSAPERFCRRPTVNARRRIRPGSVIITVYRKLFSRFGSQHWWPAKTRLEVAVGAVLTQNTSWRNVEMAIANLRKAKALSFRGLRGLPRERLSALIRPAGYYNIKAARLACLMEFFDREFGGNLDRARSTGTQDLRERLLAVKGIGRETADSILLYAFNRPMFVVDAYTRRFALRHGLLNGGEDYAAVQKLFMQNLKCDVKLFNEYHALIVRLNKDFCRKKDPLCGNCPLKGI
ncbi:MAG: endonuclease III domain-containing protein [Elusimicrobia bacterium]|nr:endonuclease III domain-containing protein [Elusimicrobiota bacterium]